MLSKKNNHIKTMEIFNCGILKVNKNKLLLSNIYLLDITFFIIKDNKW